MARTLQLVDSESVLSSISLLSTSGMIGQAGGLPSSDLDSAALLGEDPLAMSPVVDEFMLNLYGSSQDNAASQLQALAKMLRKAKHYLTTNWQYQPIYLQAQQQTETNARYAMVFGAHSLGLPDPFDVPFETDSRLEGVGLKLIREHPWRGSVPGTLPAALTLTKTDGSVDKTRTWLSSFLHTQAASHLFNYDSSLTSFSANQIAATGITLFSVAGATPAAGDIVYIGFDTRVAGHFIIPITTIGNFTADIVPEAYISAAWTALTQGSGYTIFPATDPDNLFKVAGETLIAFNPGANWQTTAINGVTASWVRLRLNSVSAWTTTPVSHATETCYTPKKNYFEISNARVAGDAPPRLKLRLYNPNGGALTTPAMGACNRVIIGAKSRNLTNFSNQLPLHNYGLPGSWARTLGTDATEVAMTTAPEGYRLNVSFATDATMVERCQLYGTGLFDDYVGAYRIFLACEQSTGDAGDVQVKLRVVQGGSASGSPMFDTETVKLTGVDKGWEVVDLGLLNLPFTALARGDTVGGDLVFKLFAERTAGSSTFRACNLILIPVDEWYLMVDDPVKDTTSGSSALRSDAYLDVDLGVLSHRTAKFIGATGTAYPSEHWNRSIGRVTLEPATQYRFFSIFMHYPTTWGTGPLVMTIGQALGVEVYAVNSYLTLRGNG